MAENLNYEMTGLFVNKCYDNKPENCDKYGRLYDWATAKKACPNGWHLPNNYEWQVLYLYADGIDSTTRHYVSTSLTAGKFLKATSGWNSNGNGVDKFGFAALPGGSGDSAGSFKNIGNSGNWWSATNINAKHAHHFFVSYSNDYASVSNYLKTSLFSVRCVMGYEEPTSIIPLSVEANNLLGGLADKCMGEHCGGRRGPALAKGNTVLKNVTILKKSRNKEDILQVVNERMPELKKTYSSYLKQYAGWTGGKLVLKFTIAPSGDIISISIVSSTTGNSSFDDDIKEQVSKWKWEAVNGENITSTMPFNFSK
jgi:TonB family protein